MAVLLTARWLTPAVAGHGTHTQLGLPPCGFLLLTSVPCPGCGLTTAFAYMSRGELVAAFEVNPLGVPLFILTALLVPLSAAGAAQAWPPLTTFDRLKGSQVMVALAGLGAVTWSLRLLHIWLA